MESVFGVILCLVMIIISALTIGILIGRSMMGIRINAARATSKYDEPPAGIKKFINEDELYKSKAICNYKRGKDGDVLEIKLPPFMEGNYGKEKTSA